MIRLFIFLSITATTIFASSDADRLIGEMSQNLSKMKLISRLIVSSKDEHFQNERVEDLLALQDEYDDLAGDLKELAIEKKVLAKKMKADPIVSEATENFFKE